MAEQAAWYSEARDASERVISAWFSNPVFRRAWVPDVDLFRFHPACQELAKLAAECGDAVADSERALWELGRRNRLEKAGGSSAVESVLLATPAVLDPWREVDRLRQIVSARDLRSDLIALAGELERGEVDLDGATEKAAASIRRVRMAASRREMWSLSQLYGELATTLRKPLGDTGFSVGASQIDADTGFLRPPFSWILGAATNWGKTGFIIMVAYLAELAGLRWAILSGEDPRQLFARRFAARMAQIEARRLRDHELSREDWAEFYGVAGRASKDACLIEARGWPIERVAGEIASVTRTEGIKLWIVDYIQAFDSRRKHDTRRDHVGWVARCGIDAVRESEAAGLFTSQITMPDGNKRPTWNDLRDNKDIAHIAEAVIIGFNAKATKKGPDDKNHVVTRRLLSLEKNKDGPAGRITEIDWDDKTASFIPEEICIRDRRGAEGAA